MTTACIFFGGRTIGSLRQQNESGIPKWLLQVKENLVQANPDEKNTIYKNENSTDSNLQTRQNQLLFDVFQNPLWKDWYPDINQVQYAIVLTASPRTEKKWNTEYKTASTLSVVTPKLK